MSGEAFPTALLDDGRAFLATFTAGGWSTASIHIGDSQFAFSRDEPRGGLAVMGEAGPNETAAAVQVAVVAAPHVGTVIKIAEQGSAIADGGWVASIAVLDETFDILAPQGGTVLGVLAAAGTLVEYGQAIAEIGR